MGTDPGVELQQLVVVDESSAGFRDGGEHRRRELLVDPVGGDSGGVGRRVEPTEGCDSGRGRLDHLGHRPPSRRQFGEQPVLVPVGRADAVGPTDGSADLLGERVDLFAEGIDPGRRSGHLESEPVRPLTHPCPFGAQLLDPGERDRRPLRCGPRVGQLHLRLPECRRRHGGVRDATGDPE